MPIISNQLELSLAHADFVEDGITNNMADNAGVGFPRGTLEYCMQQKIQLQAWAPLAQGRFADLNADDNNIRQTAMLIEQLSKEYECSVSAIVLAWLMMHPANIQPVIGTTKQSRILEANEANQVSLSRLHWYQIFQTRRGRAVP
jgi:predicted oxidoreductase